MFDVRRLVVLQEVVRCGSLSAAAASLSYTTSAVSQQITALERDVGSVLLIRSPSGARPTPAGTTLLEHACGILDSISAAERDLIRLATAAPERIRIASFASAAAAILPRAFAQFRGVYPQTELELVTADPDEGVAMLRSDGVDASFITEVPGEATDFPGVHRVPVYDDEFFVVLPLRHRLAAAAEVPFVALATEQWVVSSATGTCPDTRVFQQACRRAGFAPSVTFRAEDYSTVQGFVAANMGVSLVPALAASHSRGDVAVRRVAGHRPVRRIAVATVNPPASGSPLAAMVSLLRAVGERLAADAVYSVPARPFSVA
ncbi:MAG: LysR family transcriptional regulator [Actinobacteria bacterium]|nr:LysR family transcriptional regulator [Actinomycetota bacterium]